MRKLLYLVLFIPSLSYGAFTTNWLRNTSSSFTVNGTTYSWQAGAGSNGQFLVTNGSTPTVLSFTSVLPASSTNYIQNTNTLQTGASFYTHGGQVLSTFTTTGLVVSTVVVTSNLRISRLYVDDQIIGQGTFGSGSLLPNVGSTAMLWYSRKAAFRSGQDGMGNWTDAGIGNYSFAHGLDVNATGAGATAMGHNLQAFGAGAIEATGIGSLAGGSTGDDFADSATIRATGRGSLAWGVAQADSGLGESEANLASGIASVAMGRNVTSSANYAFTLGKNLSNSTAESFMFGSGTKYIQYDAASGSMTFTLGSNEENFRIQSTSSNVVDIVSTTGVSTVTFTNMGISGSSISVNVGTITVVNVSSGNFSSLINLTDSTAKTKAKLDVSQGGTPVTNYGRLSLYNNNQTTSAEIYMDEDTSNTSVEALYIVPYTSSSRLFFGRSGRTFGYLNFSNVLTFESVPSRLDMLASTQDDLSASKITSAGTYLMLEAPVSNGGGYISSRNSDTASRRELAFIFHGASTDSFRRNAGFVFTSKHGASSWIAPHTRWSVSNEATSVMDLNTNGGLITYTVAGASTVFNVNSVDSDFRISGDNVSNVFFLDASTDRVGISTGLPQSMLDVNGVITSTGVVVTGVSSISSTTFTGGMTLFSRTVAQLDGMIATALGTSYYCSDCTQETICTSTGTATAGAFTSPADRTNHCN